MHKIHTFASYANGDSRFHGGFILVTIESNGGYGVEHHPEAGGIFPCHYERHKIAAVNYATQRARHFCAKLFVQEPMGD